MAKDDLAFAGSAQFAAVYSFILHSASSFITALHRPHRRAGRAPRSRRSDRLALIEGEPDRQNRLAEAFIDSFAGLGADRHWRVSSRSRCRISR